MARQKPKAKPALMTQSCASLPVSDHERVACGLHMASRGLASALANTVRPHGLNGMEANLLMKLDLGFSSPSEIATYLGIDASNLSRMMRKLEEAELVSRETDESNRSRVVIRLTRKGRQLALKIKPDLREMEEHALSVLSKSELKSLKNILQKVCADLLHNQRRHLWQEDS